MNIMYNFSILSGIFILWVFSLFIFTLIFKSFCYEDSRFDRTQVLRPEDIHFSLSFTLLVIISMEKLSNVCFSILLSAKQTF